jgi:DNA-binding Lrp family transcriptional regulator
MKTTTTTNGLIKRFHALLREKGVNGYEKEAMLAAYGVSSSKEMSARDLAELCDRLSEKGVANPNSEEDRWRKRLMAAIGGWLKAMNRTSNAELIKAIACRASGKATFNKIPREQLRSLYYAFTNKSRDMRRVDIITAEELDYLIDCN